MFCRTCLECSKKNSMSEKASNFRASTLNRHAESRDHKKAITNEVQSKNLAHSMACRQAVIKRGEGCNCRSENYLLEGLQ